METDREVSIGGHLLIQHEGILVLIFVHRSRRERNITEPPGHKQTISIAARYDLQYCNSGGRRTTSASCRPGAALPRVAG